MRNLTLVFLLLVHTLFYACSENEPDEIVEMEVEIEVVWESTHTFNEFISEFGDGNLIEKENVVISGIVISNDLAKNVNKKLYLQDDETGIAIAIDDDKLYEDFEEGTGLYILATGLEFNVESRTLSLESDALLTSDLLEKHIKINAVDKNISPKTITSFSQIAEDDSYKLVKVFRVQFDENLASETFAFNGETTDRELTFGDGNKITTRVSQGSTLASLDIPYNSGSMEGILIWENNNYVLIPFSEDGFNFNSTRHSLFEKMTYMEGDNSLPYQIMYPQDYNSENEYPLVIFLHGAGERGTNNTSQMSNGPGTFANQIARENYPAIVIFPQCPNTHMWSRRNKEQIDGVWIFDFPVEAEPNLPMGMVINLTKDLIDNQGVDENRVYVMGLSMGGIGTLEYLYYAPEIPAAAISLAGGHDPAHASVYGSDVAIRLYHGSNDGVVPPKYSRDMIEALDLLSGEDAEYFEADGRGHEWNYVLNDETQVLPWLWTKTK